MWSVIAAIWGMTVDILFFWNKVGHELFPHHICCRMAYLFDVSGGERVEGI
jgi:hypothetical protein